MRLSYSGNTRAQAVYARLGMNGDHYRVFEAMFSAGTRPDGDRSHR